MITSEKQMMKLANGSDVRGVAVDGVDGEPVNLTTEAANRIAPEHMEVCVDQPFDYLPLIKNAGSVFLGRYNAEPTGDYFAGPNHTLPTSGTARFYSPLGVDDFVKKMQYSYYTKDALEQDYDKISMFAKKEGLTAHARAVDIRFGKEDRD